MVVILGPSGNTGLSSQCMGSKAFLKITYINSLLRWSSFGEKLAFLGGIA